MSLCTVSRTLTLRDVSIAVPQTSPSPLDQLYCTVKGVPCAAWPSPSENRAPLTSTGRKSLLPTVLCLLSRLPPVLYGGMVLKPPGRPRARPASPVNGRDISIVILSLNFAVLDFLSNVQIFSTGSGHQLIRPLTDRDTYREIPRGGGQSQE